MRSGSTVRFRAIKSIFIVLAMLAASCSSGESDEAVAEQEVSETTVSETQETGETGESGDDDTEVPEEEVPETSVPGTDWATVEFEAASCAFDEPAALETTCGWVEVPQHWDDPEDPDTIRLHVATFTNDETPADATPVVYLEGGPGGDSFGLAAFTVETQFGPIIDQHPLVLFTQRGSALSEIDLVCEELIDLSLDQMSRVPDDARDEAEIMDAAQQCSDRVQGEGADLSAYNTVASAHDVDAIRAALGHDQWNVLGISYGTRLGQELAREHPEGIRSLILDSVQPVDPAFGSLASIPTSFDGAFDQLVAGCAASAECDALAPDLEGRVLALIAAADENPIELVAGDQLTGETYDVVVDGGRLLEFVFQALYSPNAFAAIPKLVNELESGSTNTLSALAGLAVTQAPFISNGMYASVMCHDFLAELTPAEAWENGRSGDPLFDDEFAGDQVAETAALCEIFPTGSADASVIELVTSDVPTLIMSGAYDPITPPSFAEAIAPGFSAGQLVVMPHAGHGASLGECGLEIALSFVAEPDEEVDQGCIATSAEPPWVAESLEGVEFVDFEVTELGVRGLRPAGWVDQGFGAFVRPDVNIGDQTVLAAQGAPLPASQLATLIADQLNGDVLEDGSTEVNGQTWQRWTILDGAADALLFTRTDEAFTLIVLLQTSSTNFADLEAHLVPTMLETLEAS